jgi:nucleoside-diphosphate-sugar epimerase
MKYLILGSSGQIGNHLKHFLTERGHAVDEMDIVISEEHDIRPYPNSVLEQKMKDCDFVYFLAFDVGGSRYLKRYQNTYEFISNNIRIMNTTFSYLRDAKKPFAFASSQMSSMDYSSYGTLKRLGELYTRAIGGLTVRFWNVYGIENDEEKSHVITDFIKKAIGTGVIDMITDGQEERQFLYADDCCECLHTLSYLYDSLDRTEDFHISSFEWVKVMDIAKMVQSNIPCTIIPSSDTDSVQKNAKNDPSTNILKYWSPKTSISDGIKIMCEYYSSVGTSVSV